MGQIATIVRPAEPPFQLLLTTLDVRWYEALGTETHRLVRAVCRRGVEIAGCSKLSQTPKSTQRSPRCGVLSQIVELLTAMKGLWGSFTGDAASLEKETQCLQSLSEV